MAAALMFQSSSSRHLSCDDAQSTGFGLAVSCFNPLHRGICLLTPPVSAARPSPFLFQSSSSRHLSSDGRALCPGNATVGFQSSSSRHLSSDFGPVNRTGELSSFNPLHRGICLLTWFTKPLGRSKHE